MKGRRTGGGARRSTRAAETGRGGGERCARPALTGSGTTRAEYRNPKKPPVRPPSRLVADKILTSGNGSAGERKLVTILFGVIEWAASPIAYAPEDMLGCVEKAFQVIADLVESNGGIVAEVASDSFKAVFGAPTASEDHAFRACNTALAIRAATERPAPNRFHGFNLSLGVYTDRLLVDSAKSAARIDSRDLNPLDEWASLMRRSVTPGAVMVTAPTYLFVKDLYEFRPLWVGPLDDEEPAMFELVAATSFRTRFEAATGKKLSRFVGRERELAVLTAAVERARGGRGHAVRIVGDAGVGKSRLIIEFRRTLADSGALFLEGRCTTFGTSTSYLPFVEMLKTYAHIEPGEPAEITKEKVRACMEGLDADGDLVSALHEMLSLAVEDEAYTSLDPKVRQERIFRALTTVLVGEARRRPVVVVVEDCHWIDPSSEKFLAHLISAAEGTKLCLVLVHRLEYAAREELGHTETLHLDSIAPDAAMDLVRSILGDRYVAPDVLAFVLDRTEGNPLFIEEITRALVERGLIELDGERYELSGDPSLIEPPATVEAVIGARMDRLKTRTKRTMQAAAVIGREFPADLLGAMLGRPRTLDEDLATLEQLEFIHRAASISETAYVFKHALTQDVAYNGMIRYRRRDLHEQVGRAIESLHAGQIDSVCEVLAHHYFTSENWEKAYTYLMLSAEKARQRNAPEEAYHFYKDALAALKSMPDGGQRVEERMEVLLAINSIARWAHQPPDTKAYLLEGEKLAEATGDVKALAVFRGALAVFHQAIGDAGTSREYAAKCLMVAEKAGGLLADEHDLQILVPFAMEYSGAKIVTGRFSEALSLSLMIIEAVERSGMEERGGLGTIADPYITMLTMTAMCCLFLGRFDQGMGFVEKARGLIRDSGNDLMAMWTDIVEGVLLCERGRWEQAGPVCRAILGQCKEGTLGPYWSPTAWGALTIRSYLAGDLVTALQHCEEGRRVHFESGVVMHLAVNYCLASLVELDLGQTEAALDHAEQALQLARKNNERHWEGFALGCLGKVLGQPEFHRFSEAESSILQAIEVLEEIGMKPYVARGYLYLGELYANAGRKTAGKKYLKKAARMFREMDMESWRAKAVNLLERV